MWCKLTSTIANSSPSPRPSIRELGETLIFKKPFSLKYLFRTQSLYTDFFLDANIWNIVEFPNGSVEINFSTQSRPTSGHSTSSIPSTINIPVLPTPTGIIYPTYQNDIGDSVLSQQSFSPSRSDFNVIMISIKPSQIIEEKDEIQIPFQIDKELLRVDIRSHPSCAMVLQQLWWPRARRNSCWLVFWNGNRKDKSLLLWMENYQSN